MLCAASSERWLGIVREFEKTQEWRCRILEWLLEKLPCQILSFTCPWPREPWDRLDIMSKMCCAVLLLVASLGKPCSKQVTWRTHITTPIRPCTAAALLCGFLRSSTFPLACLAFALPLEHGVKLIVATSTAITVSLSGDLES